MPPLPMYKSSSPHMNYTNIRQSSFQEKQYFQCYRSNFIMVKESILYKDIKFLNIYAPYNTSFKIHEAYMLTICQ